MSLGLAAHLAPRNVTRSFVRALHVTAFTCLGGAALIALAYQASWPALLVWPAMIALVPMAAVLYLLDRSRTRFFSSAYLVVGGASVYWYSLTFSSQIDLATMAASTTIALPKIALVTVGGSGIGAAAGLRWCAAGFVVAEVCAAGAVFQNGGTFSFDAMTVTAWIVTMLLLALVHTGNRTTRRSLSLLNRAAREELVSTLQRRIEIKAAALLHDTILSHLAAISTASPGPVNPILLDQIERDVAILVGEEWLRDDAPAASIDEDSSWHSSHLYQSIHEARALGLEVDATGDSAALMKMDCERSSAVGLAVKQCLVNVLKHSGTMDAEVAVHTSIDELLVMVVDTGRGFAEHDNGPDRLGLRYSVRERIEAVGGSVQVWSTPGRGTSVVMRVPVGGPPEPGIRSSGLIEEAP